MKFDSAVGVRLSGNYVKFQGFEVEGIAHEISYEDAVANWWIGDRYYNGSGIVTDGHHVEVSNNIVHATPASGISAQHGDFVTLKNNIVYDCDWWTIAGSKGIGVTNATSSDGSTTAQNIKIENNLIFNVESRVISRVWSKGKAHMTIDEGEGILVQINNEDYVGRYLIKNNFLLFTGKGIVVNKTDKADLIHNTLYRTGTTISGNFKGLRGNSTDNTSITGNAVSIVPYGYAYNMGGGSSNLSYGKNCLEGNESVTIDGFHYTHNIFRDPKALDFEVSSECMDTGASQTVWQELKAKADEYAISIKPTNWKPNYVDVTRRVLESIPQEATVDWTTWSDSEAFDLYITNLPNDVSGRPSTFTLEVVHPYKRVDIAHKYGKATQGTDSSYYYYQPASYAIDNNDSTNNHTRGGKNGKNWLQIELPHPTKISKILLQNTNGNAYRLTNAKVYLSDTSYTGTVDEDNLVQTLEATNNEQIIEFATPKSGNYLLIKGEQRSQDDRHIHLKKLEVYGEMPTSPVFNTETLHLISSATAQGTIVTNLGAVDYQEDTLTYSIVGTVPFSVDAQGNLVVNGTLSGGTTYSFEIEVSDGVNRTRQSMTVDVTSNDVIADVLASGDVVNTKVTEEELVQATLDEIEATKNFMQDAKVKIFNLNSDGTVKSDGTSLTSIDWTPTHDASIMLPTLGKNSAFLYTNAVEAEGYTIYHKPMGTLGEKGNGRYVVFGSNPLRNGVNDEMNQVLENTISWLTKRDDLKIAPFNVVIAHLDESYYFKDESATRNWLDIHYAGQVTYNSENSCDGTALSGCLNNTPDLLIISQVSNSDDNVTQISSAVNEALANGISVLYIHHDGDQKTLGKALFLSVFDVSYEWDNYWKRLKLEGYNPTVDMGVVPPNIEKIKTLFTHLKEKDYAFDWSVCKDGDKVGSQYDDCSEVVGLNSEFQEGATEARSIINALDSTKKNIFEQNGYKFQKLLALTADKFRQSVHYPMDKVTTDDNDFMKSYYADHVVYNYRKTNPLQPDMGNFSSSDFSAITPTTRVVNIESKRKFKATGAYALPGQTVKVTRSDSSDLTVKVFINSLRSGATHQYQKNAYNRPKYLQTPHFEIKSGESIELTSPYGGPIQLEFSKNDLPVTVTFENVGEHPFWASSADNASFTEKLNAGNYNWAEIATAGFTVHSKLAKMRESIADTRWGGTAEGLANAVVQYTSNYPHVLAGFKGEGVDIVPEINDWATVKGLTIETIDIMKHMNADQATCGYGCSGNPYDAYWAFNPIGHGDIHEMGHSMQMMRFEGFPNHAATNTFSYYTKLRYFENTGEYGDCQGLPFKNFFDTVQSSVGQSDVEAYLKTHLWDVAGLGEQYLLKIEAMMHAQKLGKVQKGWHVLARVHILEREMSRAKQDWDARKASVGFSTYSLDEINAIRNNDWLTVAYSYASELDLRDYFDMMGIPFSQKAHDQIASFGFDKAPKSLFVSTDTGYCQTDDYGTLFDRPTLPMDGSTAYSY